MVLGDPLWKGCLTHKLETTGLDGKVTSFNFTLLTPDHNEGRHTTVNHQ